MSVHTITRAIESKSWTDSELNQIAESVRYARAQLQRSVRSSLRVGDRVEWMSNKQGRKVQGVVVKIAIKYVTVQEQGRAFGGLWRVPANMLTRVELDVA